MKTTYFIFGEQAADIIGGGGSLKDAVRAGCETFKFTDGDDPVNLLAAYTGWNDFYTCTEEEFNIVNNLIENER